VVFEIVRVAWLAGAAVAAWIGFENTKVLAAEVTELKPVLADFVAVTTHVAAVDDVRLLPLIEHPVPLTE
jgi:hypothetical protein